ncbi:MAG: hypothetical protein RRE21_00565 [Desulfurococcales archaeon]|jgi:hypothetical protein|nr:hypothetical protein [Desulfurococcales archaeon]
MKFNVRDLGSIEGYLGLDKGVDGNLKRYVVETASYNLSTAISSNLVNVMAIRLMGFGVLELSILTISRTLFVTLGSIVALPLIYRFREHRLKLWLVFGGLNRIGWALSIFTVLLPHPLNSVALIALVSAVQVSGAVAGIASTDTNVSLALGLLVYEALIVEMGVERHHLGTLGSRPTLAWLRGSSYLAHRTS